MTVKVGTVLKYSLLPGIVPRVTGFFSSGFSHLALYMACAFRSVRLLPPGHPYLSAANAGRYGIRHVLAEGHRHLVYKKENIDQIIIYYTLLFGIFLFVLQFAMLLFSYFAGTAHAGPFAAYVGSFFTTPVTARAAGSGSNDIAFILMDYVFGVSGIFQDAGGNDTCLAVSLPCFNGVIPPPGPWPTPWHAGLHFMFRFYNTGVLAVALIVSLYLVVTTTVETAQTGTPFGHRFNRVWAPVRLILALSLLTMLPMGVGGSQGLGFNLAQIITLHVAKWGSSLATRGWLIFNTTLGVNAPTAMGTTANLVYQPNAPAFNTFLEFMFVAHTCIAAERYINNRTVQFFQIRQAIPSDPGNPAAGVAPSPGSPVQALLMPPTLATALIISANRDIHIRVGELDTAYADIPGNVAPICGEFVYPIKDINSPGALALQTAYYAMIYDMAITDPLFQTDGRLFAQRATPTVDKDPSAVIPDISNFQTDYIDYYNADIVAAIAAGRAAQIADTTWLTSNTETGWGGAGIWYNNIAQYNGSFVAAAYGLPMPRLYPSVMETVRRERSAFFADVSGEERFNPALSDGAYVEFERPGDLYIALALYNAQKSWNNVYERQTGNSLIDTIRAFFGVQGLYNFLDNTTVHPMVQLTGIGRSMVESAIMNLGVAFGSVIGGGIANVVGMAGVSNIGMSVASAAGQIAVLGLSMGFVLAYVVPMLPFLYFFFAVGGWVKGVFEAMIGLPLWAMAHIRIDGEGLPGSAAMNGYYLIFEILIRPFLIVFGLIASLVIFAAQVFVLHSVWSLVITNLTGFDGLAAGRPAAGSGLTGSIDYVRNGVSWFFFTIIYSILAYMMATASFKLIDQIPDRILRWMGTGVTSFGEHEKDPAQHLVSYSFMGAQLISGKLNEGLGSLMKRNH